MTGTAANLIGCSVELDSAHTHLTHTEHTVKTHCQEDKDTPRKTERHDINTFRPVFGLWFLNIQTWTYRLDLIFKKITRRKQHPLQCYGVLFHHLLPHKEWQERQHLERMQLQPGQLSSPSVHIQRNIGVQQGSQTPSTRAETLIYTPRHITFNMYKICFKNAVWTIVLYSTSSTENALFI